MDIDTARKLLRRLRGDGFELTTSRPTTRTRTTRVAAAIEKVDARTSTPGACKSSRPTSAPDGPVDTFLLMTVSLALVVGVIGIINTMLMSTTERFIEFGVLRTNGWSQGNILALVTLESGYLGLLSGIVGCVLAIADGGGGQPVHLGGSATDASPLAVRPRHRPVARHRHARRPVSRLAQPGSCRWTRSGSGRIERDRASMRIDERCAEPHPSEATR